MEKNKIVKQSDQAYIEKRLVFPYSPCIRGSKTFRGRWLRHSKRMSHKKGLGENAFEIAKQR